ncbi:MAG: two-component system sensor histidine kinase BarA [Cellvibrionaceae bacterium]|jgi:two-component system sensor histidine kinase BarA
MLPNKWIPTSVISLAIIIALAVVALFAFAGATLKIIMFICSCIVIIGLLLVIFQRYLRSKDLTKPAQNGVAILLVDDSKANRRIVIEILRFLSLTIVEAENGEEAVDYYHKQPFALILMDIEMEKMSGLEAVKKIRDLETDSKKRLPIIAISAHSSNEKRLEALTVGFDEYLTKPLDNEELLNTLDRWLTNQSVIKEKNRRISNFSSLTHDNHLDESTSDSNKKNIKYANTPTNAALEFIKEKSTDDSGTINKVVDVKQSLIFSRNNYDLAKEMLRMLIALIQEERHQIEILFNNNQWKKLGSLVHKINGGSCYCGVPELQRQAKILDNVLEKNQIDNAKNQFSAFIRSIDELIKWAEEHDIDIIFDH